MTIKETIVVTAYSIFIFLGIPYLLNLLTQDDEQELTKNLQELKDEKKFEQTLLDKILNELVNTAYQSKIQFDQNLCIGLNAYKDSDTYNTACVINKNLISFGKGLFYQLYPNENHIKAVIAHELGHIYFQHYRNTPFSVLPINKHMQYILISLQICLLLIINQASKEKLKDSHVNISYIQLPITLAAIPPLIASYIYCKRKMEYIADSFANNLIADRGLTIISLFKRFNEIDDEYRNRPEHSFAKRLKLKIHHLYGWSSHPSHNQRIECLESARCQVSMVDINTIM